MSIPLVDLKAQWATLRHEMEAAIAETLEQTAFIMGDRVRLFEQEFAKFCGVEHAVACSSGTTALHLALIGAEVDPGDEVICPSHTFVATAEAVCHCGATPVFVDIDPASYTMDPAAVEAAITKKTRAIIPVHIYGQLADMAALHEIASKRGLALIEDAAQAHGARAGKRRAGGLADFGCFSFYPGKNLGAYGDGGAVTTNDAVQAERLRLLANHGRHTKYEHEMIGYNYRLDALQGAVLRVKLPHLPAWTEARQRLAHRYNDLLKDVQGLTLPQEVRDHVYHLYVVQCDDREALAKALKAKGIDTGIHYPIPLHLQPCFHHLPGCERGRLPVTEALCERILSLPLYPELTDEQQNQVVEAIRDHLG